MGKIDLIKSIWEIMFIQKTLKVISAFVVFYIFIKIANTLIKKILTKISTKTKSHESKKQIQTVQTVAISVVDTILSLIMTFQILAILGIDIRPFWQPLGLRVLQ